jgi:hypothetical protein
MNFLPAERFIDVDSLARDSGLGRQINDENVPTKGKVALSPKTTMR